MYSKIIMEEFYNPQNPKKTTVLFSVRRFLQFFGLYAKTIIARALGFALLDLQKYGDSRGGIQILLRWRHL